LYPGGDWEPRRFRPNLLVDIDTDGWVEDGWCGHAAVIGSVTLLPRQPCIRCTMVTRPQPRLQRDLDIYRTLARHHGGTLGVWAQVQTTGTVRVDQQVQVHGP
jgi:MOSC domain-containing protein